jgi:hypothetical protein
VLHRALEACRGVHDRTLRNANPLFQVQRAVCSSRAMRNVRVKTIGVFPRTPHGRVPGEVLLASTLIFSAFAAPSHHEITGGVRALPRVRHRRRERHAHATRGSFVAIGLPIGLVSG